MLTVIIETRNHEEALARTLASLVPGAVEGVVREVIVADRGSDDQTFRVAEHAGCNWMADTSFASAAGRARGEWLLLLEPGARLLGDWTEPVRQHCALSTSPARFARSRAAGGFFARVLAARRPLADGLLVMRPQAQDMSRGDTTGAQLAARLRSRRLEAQIMPAVTRR